jgi:hypothetical protein
MFPNPCADIPREPGEYRGSRGGGAEDSRLASTADVDPALLRVSSASGQCLGSYTVSSIIRVTRAWLTSHRELGKICESTAKWTTENKNFARRVLDAERVAKALEGVMSEIQAANQRFLVQHTSIADRQASTNLDARWRLP